ncbi:MAG: response regulator [Terracidiphilus sp.]|nr:response regulator [Terracidiphilus sp.]MDR3775419.1 response regulator [Terracidiphilus sp.]
MTTELTQPQAEVGAAPAVGQGPSQGHRRRRRRRKNKTTQASAPQAQLPLIQPQATSPAPPPIQAAAPPKAAPARKAHQNQGQQGRKKKFFPKGSATAAQPGNSFAAPPQAKRKSSSRQKGPREFVGPMDHSYRMVNGNVADGPPSTIQMMSSGYSNQFQESYAPEPVVPVRENAQTRIFCFIEDLFFQAKIQETSRKLGIKVEFVKGDKESVAKITALPEEERPSLLVFDLNNLNAKPMTLIPKFKTKFKKATSIIGFLNHLQGDLKLKAIDVGCDTVMPRSAFSQSLPNLLRRYGVEEEEEDQYAQQPM